MCLPKSCDRFTRRWLSVQSDRRGCSRHLCVACLHFSSASGGKAASPRQMDVRPDLKGFSQLERALAFVCLSLFLQTSSPVCYSPSLGFLGPP